jgi:hypothetical protein
MKTPPVCPNCDAPDYKEICTPSIQIYHGKPLVVENVRKLRCACGFECLTDEQANELTAKTKEKYLAPRAF